MNNFMNGFMNNIGNRVNRACWVVQFYLQDRGILDGGIDDWLIASKVGESRNALALRDHFGMSARERFHDNNDKLTDSFWVTGLHPNWNLQVVFMYQWKPYTGDIDISSERSNIKWSKNIGKKPNLKEIIPFTELQLKDWGEIAIDDILKNANLGEVFYRTLPTEEMHTRYPETKGFVKPIIPKKEMVTLINN